MSEYLPHIQKLICQPSSLFKFRNLPPNVRKVCTAKKTRKSRILKKWMYQSYFSGYVILMAFVQVVCTVKRTRKEKVPANERPFVTVYTRWLDILTLESQILDRVKNWVQAGFQYKLFLLARTCINWNVFCWKNFGLWDQKPDVSTPPPPQKKNNLQEVAAEST